MTDFTVTNGKSEQYPTNHYGAHFVGNRATFCLDQDFSGLSANVLAIPTLPLTILSSSPVTVTDTFFGMHIKSRVNDSVTGLTFKTVRSHDMENGKGRWKYIETSDNVWDFTDLDSWVNTHYAAGRDLVFTLFGTPTWASARPTEQGAYGIANLGTQAEPSDMTKWTRFCNKIATRYLGKIKYYEVWNEPNQYNDGTGATPGTNFFFSGTFAKLAEMVRLANQTIKAVDPTAKIISPSITSWSTLANQSAENYFNGMMVASDGATGVMKDWVDIIAVHLYSAVDNTTKDLSGMIDRVNAAKSSVGVSGMETWDTESAPIIPSAPQCSVEILNRFLNRFMITAAAKGIARTMYYQYDSTMGFKDRTAIITNRDQIIALLKSGNILTVSKFSDGRVGYYTNSGLNII
jgi:hypothetical protein